MNPRFQKRLILSYFEPMQEIASFVLILSVYFLGILAIVQEVSNPKYINFRKNSREMVRVPVNYGKILTVSFLLALLTTALAYYLFI
ncbi:hypothetical protein [Algoriphagus formosus]|uniref:Uncharacterized protein n=1 Tax=Algoriphagus formosus TaxID=2007308 RepID=A0A4R5URB8_9BACT|nr:hypothetical protein [Algoriphagus aquimaris]TDK41618.1 hypothetical protein E1898_16650 [Algoriphagus aquimaris]